MEAALLVRLPLIVLLSVSWVANGSGEFDQRIRPLLESRCLECHDTKTLKGGIGLETHYHAHLPTDAGAPLLVPGKPDQSVLLHVVMESDPEKRMPPKGKPLTAAEIATIRQWIAEGAKWPDDGWRPPKHWSYVVPQKSPAPDGALPADREGNEIDAFVVAKLAGIGLSLNPEADPARLLRRIHLDLTGLPLRRRTPFSPIPLSSIMSGSSMACSLRRTLGKSGRFSGSTSPATPTRKVTSAIPRATCGLGATGSSPR